MCTLSKACRPVCRTVLSHVGHSFHCPRGCRDVGLCACGSTSTHEWSRAASTTAARVAALAARHRRPLLPSSRAARPPRGLDQGTGSFGTIAITLITLAALVGAGLFIAHVRKRRIAGIVIGIRATLAVGGLVILAAYVFAG